MRCVHMRSAGNDFMVLDGRGKNLDFPAMARKLCAMVGADGFMALGESQTADFRMHFYNRDGSRAAMCGNGSRCICKFAYDLALVGEEMTVQTDAGLIPGRRLEDTSYQVGLPVPEKVELQIKPEVDFCVCGVPHAVFKVQELKKEALYERARALRYELCSNVDFYTPLAPERVAVLTYERGVEDFTPACGTGCGAVTAALYAAGKLPQKTLIAVNPGGELKMEIAEGCILQTGLTETLRQYTIEGVSF